MSNRSSWFLGLPAMTHSVALYGACIVGLATLVSLGSPAFAGHPYKKFVLQCPPTIVAQCPSGKVLKCVQYNGQGCCTKTRCQWNN